MCSKKSMWLVACALVLGAPVAGWAQVHLKIKMEQTSLLPYEPAHLVIKFANKGGSPVLIKEQDSSYRFRLDLIRDDGSRVESRSIPIIHDKLILPPNESREFRLNLLKVFSLHQQGMYTAKAMVIQNGKIGVMAKAYFDIVSGVEVSRYITPQPMRIFILRTVNRDRADRLLVHIQDEQGDMVYGVYDLGSWMRGYAPEVRTDPRNNLHLLHRSSPTQYNHSVFSTEGRPLNRDYYRIGQGLPQLKPTPKGGMEVVGAERVGS